MILRPVKVRYTSLPVSPLHALVASLVFATLLASCVPVTVVSEHPVPPADLLKPEDCALYVQEVLRVDERRSAAEPDPTGDLNAMTHRATSLMQECNAHLAGKVRRVIVHCWHDSIDAPTLRRCNGRF